MPTWKDRSGQTARVGAEGFDSAIQAGTDRYADAIGAR
jgi:hypothetical protein